VYAKKRVLANIYFKSVKESNAIRIQATLNSGISVSVIYLLFYSKSFPVRLHAMKKKQVLIIILSKI